MCNCPAYTLLNLVPSAANISKSKRIIIIIISNYIKVRPKASGAGLVCRTAVYCLSVHGSELYPRQSVNQSINQSMNRAFISGL